MNKQKNACRGRKRAWFCVFAGLLLLLGGITLGNSLLYAVRDANGILTVQKMVVSVKNPLESHRTVDFTMDQIERLADLLDERSVGWVAYPPVPAMPVTNGTSSMTANVTGLNSRNLSFNHLILVAGSFLSSQDEKEGKTAAVIEDTIAWNLFKTNQVIGRTVNLYNTPFTIIGVIKSETDLLQALTDDGLPQIYISAGKLLELDQTAKITCFQVQAAQQGINSRNAEEVSTALQSVGKDPNDYVITDYPTEFRLLSQKPQLSLWIFGFISILILAIYAIKAGIGLVKRILVESKDKSIVNAIRDNISNSVVPLLIITSSLAGILLIYLGIRFQLYIPPQYIPDDFINLSYYLNLFKNGVQQSISLMGHITPPVILALNAANACMTAFVFILPLTGTVLLILGLLRLFHTGTNLLTISWITACLTILSLLVALTAARFLGLPVVIETKGILVSWAFIYILTIHLFIRKERDYE